MMKLTIVIVAGLLAIAGAQRPQPRQTRPQPRATACGAMPSFMTGDRIVGGEDAASPIPWQVSVRQCQSGGCHFCGGTILDETTVMSAAHCFTSGQSMSGYYITAGVTNRHDTSGQTIEIANGVWNAEMPYQGNNNDFVILKLSSALTFNDNVGPACLPEPDFAPDTTGQTCFVSGWGTLESGAQSLPNQLQWVAVPTVTNEQCNQAYGGITSSMICAGLSTGGKDSCQGDSGGPFVCRNSDGNAALTGVVSFGIGCALATHPGVYARQTAVLDWVKANMGSDGAPVPPGPPPSPTPTTTAPNTTACIDHWIGDGYCDDENNNEECQLDGGDCCQDINTRPDGWDKYCSDCQCVVGGDYSCELGVPHWVGDGYCDDENNNAICGFDGGDCCPGTAHAEFDGWDNYCNECKCVIYSLEMDY